jgi:predicted extracellular nuclease
MGDFNDYPTNKSMESVLKAQDTELNIEQDKLYNLFYHYQKEGKIGSHKFDGEWGMLDQIIVSGNLLMSNKSISISLNSAQIFAPEYLLEDDARYMGKKPFRTFAGQKYLEGYSDHLPIYIDLIVK